MASLLFTLSPNPPAGAYRHRDGRGKPACNMVKNGQNRMPVRQHPCGNRHGIDLRGRSAHICGWHQVGVPVTVTPKMPFDWGFR